MKRQIFSAAFLVASIVPPSAPAQTFPSKPVEFVVPGNPGAGSDISARVVADIIRKEKYIAQPIVINNRGGGGGAVASAYVAGRRGDPYTVIAFPTGMMLTAPLRSNASASLPETSRAAKSPGPPGGETTINRIGRRGKSSVAAPHATPAHSAAQNAIVRSSLRKIRILRSRTAL